MAAPTAHERRISVGVTLRVGRDYRAALRRAHDHYHRGALGDAAQLVSGCCPIIPDHDADSTAQALYLYANVAARRCGIFSDDPATSPYLEERRDAATSGGGASMTMANPSAVGQDDISDALERYVDVARLVEEELGGDAPRLAAVLLNRGIVCLQAGRLVDAEQLLRGCLSLLKKCFGDDHIVAADAHHNLGALAEHRRDFELAKSHYVHSLMIRSKFDDNQRQVDQALVETMTSLAMASWRCDGDACECVRQLQRLVPLARRLPKRPASDLALAATLCHLGAALITMGSFAKAATYLSQAHTLRSARLGADHPMSMAAESLLHGAASAAAGCGNHGDGGDVDVAQ